MTLCRLTSSPSRLPDFALGAGLSMRKGAFRAMAPDLFYSLNDRHHQRLDLARPWPGRVANWSAGFPWPGACQGQPPAECPG